MGEAAPSGAQGSHVLRRAWPGRTPSPSCPPGWGTWPPGRRWSWRCSAGLRPGRGRRRWDERHEPPRRPRPGADGRCLRQARDGTRGRRRGVRHPGPGHAASRVRRRSAQGGCVGGGATGRHHGCEAHPRRSPPLPPHRVERGGGRHRRDRDRRPGGGAGAHHRPHRGRDGGHDRRRLGAIALYDMVKGLDRGAEIGPVRLLYKAGGASGEWRR